MLKPPKIDGIEIRVSQNALKDGANTALKAQLLREKFNRETDFVLIDQETKRRIELVHRTTVIGRNQQNPIVINDISVSLKHAQIEIQDVPATVNRAASKRCYLVDLSA